jgi:capsular exopolysaccharide synthesis family protein
LKTILLTDVEGSEVNAITIANLGTYLSHNTGNKVLIIDANFRKPSLHQIFNIPNSRGFTNVLDEKIKLDDTIIDLGSHLYFLPTGKTMSNGLALLNSPIMSDVIKKVKEQYDIIFVRCADIKNFTDAVILSSITDGLIVSINEEKDRRQIVKKAIAPFQKQNAKIIGAILNDCKYVIPKMIYKIT